MKEENNVLEIENLSVEYHTDSGVVKAVNKVGFALEKGKTIGLVGETGAGKTTIALSILGLLTCPPAKIVEGTIRFEDMELFSLKEKRMREVRGNKISMIFQDPMTALNPIEKVGWQIMEVIRLHEKISQGEAVKRAIEILELVGIPAERFDDYPHQFSGGMKQRIVIAIALACKPDLLIADEPTTALDVTIQAQVLDLIKNLQKKMEMSVILITHDLGIVAETCDMVGVVYAGEMVEIGTAEDIFDRTMHPYTIGLFGSLPILDGNSKRLVPIPGAMPDPTKLPKGCAFAERCAKATDACREMKPELEEIEQGHYVRCHMVKGGK